MRNVYSVSQINSYIRRMFTEDYLLRDVLVRGEVSNCKYHASGHIYFTIKDASGTLSCVMFAGRRRGLSFHMQNGDQVIVGGTIDVYARSGSYQLYAGRILRDGVGELAERFEMLKKKLLEQGMFDAAYKQPVPRYIRSLGVVTAATGAAVRDIIQIAKRRNPFIEIILYPAIVQGEAAPDSIVRGIRTLDARGVDVIIIGRGGGSLEDLWAFNEEKVAQAVFDCMTPVISAVGHETDTVITDFVADLRAPTPSAAAELAVYDLFQYEEDVRTFYTGLHRGMQKNLQQYRLHLDRLGRELHHLSPDAVIRDQRMTAQSALDRLDRLMAKMIDDSRRLAARDDRLWYLIREKINDSRKAAAEEERLELLITNRIAGSRGRLAAGLTLAHHMDRALSGSRHRMELLAGSLEHLSPLTRLSGGYGFVSLPDGRSVRSVSQLGEGDPFRVRLRDGTVDAMAQRIHRDGPKPVIFEEIQAGGGQTPKNSREGET